MLNMQLCYECRLGEFTVYPEVVMLNVTKTENRLFKEITGNTTPMALSSILSLLRVHGGTTRALPQFEPCIWKLCKLNISLIYIFNVHAGGVCGTLMQYSTVTSVMFQT